MPTLSDVVDLSAYPLHDHALLERCRAAFDREGVLTLKGFLRPEAVIDLVKEAQRERKHAFFTASTHNVYLTPKDPSLPEDHIFNRQVSSSKGCITTDQVPAGSGLHSLYNSHVFRGFIAQLVGGQALFEYADPLSSINVHYAGEGQELNWHFDNSEFAITLLLQAPLAGGDFEYLRDLRDAENDDMNFSGVQAVVEGKRQPEALLVEPGTLVLFRGRNAMHRVTPTQGARDRILVVLAYNSKPGIALSEAARMTFFGRLG